VTFRRDDGSETPVLVSLSPLWDGDTMLIAAILTDLSDQKQRLRQIAEANERLLTEIAERERTEEALRQSQKMQAIGQLTGGIAHDFNNMLQAIATSVELATQRISGGRGQEAPRFLDTARQSIDRAAALTHSLLAFSRRQAQTARQVDVVALLGKTSSLIRQTVGPEIALDLQLGDASWPVRCDPKQLENALLNLAINARDAMLPAGGRLLIRTGGEMLEARDLVGWESARPGDFVRITVADTGTGMSSETLAHVFEPFFTTKPDGAGTGLGLSQVYGFVAQSGGLIRLESEVGRGTAAHLLLPRDLGATEGEERRTARRDAVPATMARVLLVDDESDVRRLFAEALREAGHVVIEAETGPRALEVVRRAASSLDILVTDVGLPGGMNGRQLAEAVRQTRPDMPVLLITGYAGDALSPQQELPQDIRTLRKPFGLEALAAHVRSMLAGGQPAG